MRPFTSVPSSKPKGAPPFRLRGSFSKSVEERLAGHGDPGAASRCVPRLVFTTDVRFKHDEFCPCCDRRA